MTATPLYMAELYDDLGLCVIPLQSKSKKPAIKSWKRYQDERPSRPQITKWFRGGQRNIGIPCGHVSENTIVRDFDSASSYESWRSRYPDAAAELPTVQTARGKHVYARTAQAVRSKCLDDGELRGDGSYVVAPPSLHPDGITYTWIRAPHDDIPIVDPYAIGFLDVTQEIVFLCDTSHAFPASEQQLQRSRSARESSQVETTEDIVADLVRRAIRKSQPLGPGQRHHSIFRLVQFLKQIPAIGDGRADYDIFGRWFRVALPVIRTKDFQESWHDFCYAWRHCRTPKGMTLRAAAGRADDGHVPDSVTGAKTRKLAAVCIELQRLHGSKPFFLDCRNAGLLIGCGYQTAHRALRGLCDDGHMEKVSTGSFESGKANEYRWKG